MKRLALLVALLLAAITTSPAQTATGPVQGTLYVSVDQTATIYLNGKNIKFAKKKGESTAPVTLASGDRLVIKISSTHYYRHLALLFVSDAPDITGIRTEISFRVAHFKLMPDPALTDFTPGQFATFPKGVIPLEELIDHDQLAKIVKKDIFPFENSSEFFWGDRQDCTVGTMITEDMFSPLRPSQH